MGTSCRTTEYKGVSHALFFRLFFNLNFNWIEIIKYRKANISVHLGKRGGVPGDVVAKDRHLLKTDISRQKDASLSV